MHQTEMSKDMSNDLPLISDTPPVDPASAASWLPLRAWFSPSDVAKHLNTSRSTVYKMFEDGRLKTIFDPTTSPDPTRKEPGPKRVTRKDLAEFIDRAQGLTP